MTLAQKEVTEWRMAEILARSTAEYLSIVCAASLMTFGSVTPSAGTSVHVHSVWILASMQVNYELPLYHAHCSMDSRTRAQR